jgi:hypothetical protein
VSWPAPDRARQLPAELEQRFVHYAEPARKLNDAQQRVRRANDRRRCGLHPDGIAAVNAEHPAGVDVAFAENRSEVLCAPDPPQALQHAHRQIHQAHCDHRHAAEDRRHLAVDIDEITRRGVSSGIQRTPRADGGSGARAIDTALLRLEAAQRDRGPAS